jgi:hypothetical protein
MQVTVTIVVEPGENIDEQKMMVILKGLKRQFSTPKNAHNWATIGPVLVDQAKLSEILDPIRNSD